MDYLIGAGLAWSGAIVGFIWGYMYRKIGGK